MTRRRSVDSLQDLVDAGEKFGTIYADPPWQYEKQIGRGAANKHYDCMTVDEICALPVEALAADNAHLHLWVTASFLMAGPRILDAWGFKLANTFVWCKRRMGTGNYWRNAHEIMLTATRGNPVGRSDAPNVLICDRGAHSSKPEQVRRLIEQGSRGPYLELFGRRRVDGWTVWGNQIEDTLFDFGRHIQ